MMKEMEWGNNCIDGCDPEENFKTAMQWYNCLIKDRDDNIPALNSAMGTYVIASAFGSSIRKFNGGRSYVEAPVIHNAGDVNRMKALPLYKTILGKQIRLVEYFAEKSDGKIPVRIPDIQNPLGVAEMLWETNDFFVSLAEEPEMVHKLLEMITEVTLQYIEEIKKVCRNIIPISFPGVWAPAEKGVYLADDTMSMLSPAMYEEYGVRYNNIISREFGGIMLHSCTVDKRYFESIMKNEGIRSINFASQYSSDMSEIFDFFGGKVVILPHYYHADSHQIGTVIEFIEKVMSCWKPEWPACIYISAKADGSMQPEVFEKLEMLLKTEKI
jgi:hypothetical protein